MRTLFIPLAALALAACDSGRPEADPDSAETPVAAEPAPPVRPAPANAIPPALQGRWGLVAADCEPGRADAKGLLTIAADKLEFYESVGVLDDIREVRDDRIHASFDFTGEGMEWERDMALELQETGDALVRREYGADAAPGSFRYTKCS